MMVKKIFTVSESVSNEEDKDVDLDQALDVAGLGWYNVKYCLALTLFLISVVIEPFGYSYVLPAAKCDLEMSDTQRGFIASIPYIGVVATSFQWGYLTDTKGRKKMIIYSSLGAGIFGIAASFMPEINSFIIFKLLSSLCIACPASVPYSYIGEILPQRYRDVILSITNAMMIAGSVVVPLVAWGLLPLEFRADFGIYEYRPWRLLSALYSCSFLISAFIISFGPESPKYLLAQRRHDESLEVLRAIYAGNTGKPARDYPVKRLKQPEEKQDKGQSFLVSLGQQSLPLFKPPYLKWMCLNGFLFFGIFAMLNGLYIWIPDILNRVFSGGGGAGLTACGIITHKIHEETLTDDLICIDSIDKITYIINIISNVSCAILAVIIGATVKIIGKKVLLISVYFIIGVFAILVNFVTHSMTYAVLISSFAMTGLTIGPVNAYAVEIFPTHLRGMAISLSMMIGRFGSIIGTNVAGLLLNAACDLTFYVFGGLLILCGILSFLLPTSQPKPTSQKVMTRL